MGSSSKSKYKEKESSSSRSSKRRHASPPASDDAPREKRHKHKHRHHRDKKRDKPRQNQEGNNLVEIVSSDESNHDNPAETSSGQGAESISIQETNKLRAKLGLKPLEVGSSEASTSGKESKSDGKIKDDLGEFYHKPAENWATKAEREKLKNKFAEQREKRTLHNKLAKVKTLGESDSEDDAVNWVDKSRKIEKAKKEAEKREKMLEELDAQFGISDVIEQEHKERRNQQYTTKDLRGLRVEHDINSIAEEKQVILTLKDSGVLDEDDDVLVNVNMIDNEKYKKNVENKKKKVQYNAYEDQEYDEFGNPKEKSLLSKYDSEIDGEKRDSFRIGLDEALQRKQAAVVQSVKEKLAKKKLETIAEKNLILASEYYNEEELAQFKKPKKKTRRIRTKGKLTAEELLPTQKVEEIGSRRNKIKVDGDQPELSIDDVPDIEVSNLKLEDDKDDLLEKALHKARKIKQKENIIADILKTEIKEEPAEEQADSGNIILNSTAEFCRTLGDIPTYGKSGNRDEDEDMLDFEKEAVDDEKSDDECEIVELTGWNSVDPASATGVDLTKLAPQEVQILDEEPDVSTGMGAALKLAMSKGYLDKEQNNRPSNTRFAHLQAQHYSIEDKSHSEEGNERSGGRGAARERYSGPIQDFKEKDGFKPNVKLEYIDDDGHILNSKEAFRYLSHKFHGKGPGKNKVEKRIKKSVQEQLMKKMSSTDTPLGTLHMLQAKQKETQSPFVVLSGNKQQQQTSISKNRR